MNYPCRASDAGNLALCPGKAKAQMNLPEGPQSEDAARGTRIHALLAARAMSGAWPEIADPEESETAHVLWEKVEALSSDEVFNPPFEAEVKVAVEGGFSGTADLIMHDRSGVDFVIDYKSGRSEQVEAAANPQMRAYVVNACILGIIKPPVKAMIVTPFACTEVMYTEADVIDAGHELRDIYDACQDPDAPRNPGPACQWCRAFGSISRCPETAPATLIAASPSELTTLDQVQALPAPVLSSYLEKLALIEKIGKLLKDEAKARLTADPASVPGYKLAPGASRRTITDPAQVYAVLLPNLPDVLKAADFSLAEVAELARAKFQCTKKDAESWVNQLLAPWIETKQASAALKPAK